MNATQDSAAALAFAQVRQSPAGFSVAPLEPAAHGLDAEAVVDVVFVHGLTGDPLATWGMTPLGPQGPCSGWPIELAKSLEGKVQLWTAGFSAPLLASRSDPLTLEQQARDALACLAGAGLGRRKIVLVAHSLGGILVKEILHASILARDGVEKQFVEQTHGVIFVGTPHAGSDLTLLRLAVPWVTKALAHGVGWLVAASLGTAILAGMSGVTLFGLKWEVSLGAVLASLVAALVAFALNQRFRPSEHVLVLHPDNPVLHDATHHYRRVLQHRPFATRAFYERRRMWLAFKAVPRGSADPGITDCAPIGLDANHIGMCKGASAQPIADAVRALVMEARRGIDLPVFERYLGPHTFRPGDLQQVRPLLRKDDGSYVRRFGDVEGDRQERERILREHLRRQFLVSTPPDAVELDLAGESSFDVDLFVWCMWHERNTIASQRKLRESAARAMARWKEEFLQPRPSLIPFYRPLRTLEHGLLADLREHSTETERAEIRKLITDARAALNASCPQLQGKDANGRAWALDGGGGTRRLLLRMQCAMAAMDASYAFLEREARERHEDMARHQSEQAAWRERHAAALAAFSAALAPLPAAVQSREASDP